MAATATTAGAQSFEAVPHRTLIMACTMAATLMQALDNTIANVALPHMQGSLGASRDQITWVLTSYVISAAIFTAPVGWIANRFGRKNFFLVAMIGFTVSSALCGLAQSLPQIVLFRVAQGAFGAALIPLSQSTILDLYPPQQQGTATSIWAMGVMVGPILGPTLGGYLTDLYDWRWVFFINVPIGIAAIAGTWLFMHEHKQDSSLRFDWFGFSALAVGLGSLQLMLDRGPTQDWFESGEIITEAILAGLGFYLFLVHMWSANKPFIPPHIFKDRAFTFGLIVMFALGLVLLSTTALLPPYLQQLGGYSVQQAGLLMTPRGFGTMAAMIFAGKLSRTLDPRIVAASGIVMLAYSTWQMTEWTPDVTTWMLVEAGLLQGFGLGLIFVSVQFASFATLLPQLRTDGTALFALLRSIGMALGISIATASLSWSMQAVHSQLAEYATPFNRVLTTHSGVASAFWGPTGIGAQGLEGQIERQAAIISYENVFYLMFWISIASLPLVLLMRKPPPLPASVERETVIE